MKIQSLKKNVQFRIVYKRGKSFSNRLLVLYVYKNNLNCNRVGISVSKKVGGSIVRNRVKRLIRESFRLNDVGLKNGFDLIFIARTTAKDKSYVNIESSLLDLFVRANLYVK